MIRLFHLFLFILSIVDPATAQLLPASVTSQMAAAGIADLREKVFVHTDNDVYSIGDIIWLKVYVATAARQENGDASKVVYLEIIDATNTPVAQTILDVKNGGASGSLLIPEGLGTGYYTLRAYTRWMRNFPADLFFSKTIAILNRPAPLSPVNSAAADSSSLYLSFFPEGGNMVHNFPSRVAFKLNDAEGKGVACEGIIINEKRDTVARFSSLKFGMGHFLITPGVGHRYSSIVKTVTGRTLSADLPQVQEKGYTFFAAKTGGRLNIDIYSSEDGEIYLTGSNSTQSKWIRRSQIKSGKTQISIPLDSLGDGVNDLIVYNNTGKPVCERLYFKRPDKKLTLEIEADKQVYAPREKVDLAVASKNEREQNVQSELSMAVYKLDSLAKSGDGDIQSYVWLSSELAGKTESPEYYFGNEPLSEIAADNLMLTQGWTRFTEYALPTPDTLNAIPELGGPIITGAIHSTATDLPAAGIGAVLSVVGKYPSVILDESDSSGMVHFELKRYDPRSRLYLYTPGSSDKYRIRFLSPYSSTYTKTHQPGYAMMGPANRSIAEHHLRREVQTLFHTRASSDSAAALSDTVPFYGTPDLTYHLDDYKRFTTMEEVLREYVQTVYVNKIKNAFNIYIIDRLTNQPFQQAPLILVDGVVVADAGQLMAYDPLKVQSIRVLARKYFMGRHMYNGIIDLRTFEGRGEQLQLDVSTKIMTLDYNEMNREFYSPRYTDEREKSSRIPDYRNVLYWSPQLRADKQTHTAHFYTSDLPGKYAIVIQGSSADGRYGSHVEYIEVRK